MKLTDYQITNILRSKLLDNNELVSLVGDNISPVIVSEDVTGDVIYYTKYGLNSVSTKFGIHSFSLNVAFGIVSDDADKMNQIAWLIVSTLVISTNDISISVVDSDEESKDGKFIKTIVLQINW